MLDDPLTLLALLLAACVLLAYRSWTHHPKEGIDALLEPGEHVTRVLGVALNDVARGGLLTVKLGDVRGGAVVYDTMTPRCLYVEPPALVALHDMGAMLDAINA